MAQMNETPMEGQHGLTKSRLMKRRKNKTVSPQLLSTELRYPEFASYCNPRTVELMCGFFGTFRKPMPIVLNFGLGDHPALHASLESTNGILDVRGIIEAFYHCDGLTQYQSHKKALKTMKRLRQRPAQDNVGHAREKAPAMDEGKDLTLDNLLWKAGVEHLQQRCPQHTYLLARLMPGVHAQAFSDRNHVKPRGQGIDTLMLEDAVNIDQATGLPKQDSQWALAPYKPAEMNYIGFCGIHGQAAHMVSAASHCLEEVDESGTAETLPVCVLKVVHPHPSSIKCAPTTAEHRPRSSEVAVTVHAIQSAQQADDGTKSIDAFLDPVRDNSIVVEAQTSSILWSLPFGLSPREWHTCMWSCEKQDVQFTLQQNIPGVDANMVNDICQRLISNGASPASSDIANSPPTLMIHHDDMNGLADIHCLKALAAVGLVTCSTESEHYSNWALTAAGLSACNPVVKLQVKHSLFKCLFTDCVSRPALEGMTTWELMEYMRDSGWSFEMLAKNKSRKKLKALVAGGPSTFYMRCGQAAMSKPKLIAHILVAKELCPGPLLPVEMCKYYKDVLDPQRISKRSNGMKALKDSSEATLALMDHKKVCAPRRRNFGLPRQRHVVKALEDGPLHDEDLGGESDGAEDEDGGTEDEDGVAKDADSDIETDAEVNVTENEDGDNGDDHEEEDGKVDAEVNDNDHEVGDNEDDHAVGDNEDDHEDAEGQVDGDNEDDHEVGSSSSSSNNSSSSSSSTSDSDGDSEAQKVTSRQGKKRSHVVRDGSFWWTENFYFTWVPSGQNKKARWQVKCHLSHGCTDDCRRTRTLPSIDDDVESAASQLFIRRLKHWCCATHPQVYGATLLGGTPPHTADAHRRCTKRFTEGVALRHTILG